MTPWWILVGLPLRGATFFSCSRSGKTAFGRLRTDQSPQHMHYLCYLMHPWSNFPPHTIISDNYTIEVAQGGHLLAIIHIINYLRVFLRCSLIRRPGADRQKKMTEQVCQVEPTKKMTEQVCQLEPTKNKMTEQVCQLEPTFFFD